MRIGEDRFRCPLCGETKPLTPEHVYFDRRGRPCAFCKPCHLAYQRDYWQTRATADQVARVRRRAREYYRRAYGVTPDRWRGPYRNGVAV